MGVVYYGPGCLGEEDMMGGDSIDPVRYGSGSDSIV